MKQTVKSDIVRTRPIKLNYLRENIIFPQLPDATPEPLLITNEIGEIYYVNPAWEKFTGFKFKEVEGKTADIFSDSEQTGRLNKLIRKKLALGKSFVTEEVVGYKKNGEEFIEHATFFAVKKGKRNVFFVQVFHDITQKKSLEKHRKEFFSLASHELKTPITTLKLIIDAIKKKGANDKDYLTKIEILDTEVDRLNELVNQMLDVSRADSNKLKLDVKLVDLNEITEEVVLKMRFLSKRRKIIFKQPKISMNIWGDKYRMEQVLINLINNAIRYSKPTTKITIESYINKKHAEVSVTDQGIGIPRNKLKNVFERYFQVNNTILPGLGLGLFLSREIIKEHKGKIWVKSVIGKGSSFYFSLPLAKS